MHVGFVIITDLTSQFQKGRRREDCFMGKGASVLPGPTPHLKETLPLPSSLLSM